MSKVQIITTLAMGLLLSSPAWAELKANGIEKAAPPSHECHLRYLNGQGQDWDTTFHIYAADVGPHGGTAQDFTLGPARVSAQASNQFMNVLWEQEGRTIARIVSAIEANNHGSRALIIYDPLDESKQLHFDCQGLL